MIISVCTVVGSNILQIILLAVAASVKTNEGVAEELVKSFNELEVLSYCIRPL